MGKLKSFHVELENPSGVYYAGQLVNGRLVVELTDSKKVSELRLVFKGGAEVFWQETYEGTDEGRQVTKVETFTASEPYFNQIVPVYGRGKGMGDQNYLPPGTHFYPFSFQLPPNLPSSFEGGDGHVRYTIRGVMDRASWRKKEKDTKKPFTVIALLDLNLYPNAAGQTENQQSKTVCCLCCKSGPITGKLKVDRIGHVPGDTIYFHSEIQNLSTRVCKSYVRFYMSVIFHSTRKSKSIAREIKRVEHPEVRPGDSETWTRETVSVPSLPPSDLVGCRIIDVNYYVELDVDPSGITRELHVPTKVIIGTIPLQRQNQTQYGFSSPGLSAHASSPAQTPSAPPMADSLTRTNMPTPTYSESVFGRTSIKEKGDSEKTRGDMNFAPAYAYYDWSKQS